MCITKLNLLRYKYLIMYNYLLMNKGAQNQIDINQQLIDIDNIDEIQVLDLNTINIINL